MRFAICSEEHIWSISIETVNIGFNLLGIV